MADQTYRARTLLSLSADTTLTVNQCRYTKIKTNGYIATMPAAFKDCDVHFLNNDDSGCTIVLTGNTSGDDITILDPRSLGIVESDGTYYYACNAVTQT
jgi:hypothetical protein